MFPAPPSPLLLCGEGGVHTEAPAGQGESSTGVYPPWVWYPRPACSGVFVPRALDQAWRVSGRSAEDSENVLGELSCLQALRVQSTLSLLISGPRDGLPGGHNGGKGGGQAPGRSHFRSTSF